MSVSSRVEDYLEAILAMEIEKGKATVTELARRVGVSKATVVATCRKLMDAAMLEHEQYGDLRLTEEGRSRALQVYRRHEHLTYLFSELLGIERFRAQEIACVMEHELDHSAEHRLLGLVDYIARARREKQAWVQELSQSMEAMEQKEELCLPFMLAEPGRSYRVVRVTAEQEQRLALAEQGIYPGSEVEYLRRNDDAESFSLDVAVHKRPLSLDREQGVSIWIEEV